MKENITTYNTDDEIDIRELIISIWSGRWFIAAFILISGILSAGYIWISSGQFKAELEIHPIPRSHFDRYAELNQEKIIAVSRGELLDRFIEKLEKSDIVYNAFRDQVQADAKEQEIADIQLEIIERMENFEITRHPQDKEKKSNIPTYYTINYKGRDADQFREMLGGILSTADQDVWSDLSEYLKRKVEYLKNKRAYNLQDLENRIESLKVQYNKGLEIRLAFLKEQSSIAHELNIEKNTLSGQEVSIGSVGLATIERDAPEYLRGYRAIDKEIELIKSRVDEESYISGVPDMRMKIDEIQRNRDIERIEQAIARSPIGNRSDFLAAAYDLHRLEVEPAVKAPLVMALGLMLGLMLGIMALGMKNILAARARS